MPEKPRPEIPKETRERRRGKSPESKEPVNSLVFVLNDPGDPGETIGLDTNDTYDYSFHIGIGKLVDRVTPARLGELFPNALEMREGKLRPKYDVKDVLLDLEGLKALSKELRIPITIAKKTPTYRRRGEYEREEVVIEGDKVTPEKDDWGKFLRR